MRAENLHYIRVSATLDSEVDGGGGDGDEHSHPPAPFSPYPLSRADGNNLVQSYLATSAVFPDAPWFSMLVVNQHATRGAHTIIDASQWPPRSVDNLNYSGRRRGRAPSEEGEEPAPTSEWLLAQVVGPLPNKAQAVAMNQLS